MPFLIDEFAYETHTHKRKMEARKNIRTGSSKLCQPFWVNLWRKQTYHDMLHLWIMHEVMGNSTVFSTEISMRLFLLLNKQELMITPNIAGSLSAVISMRSWVTEYLSMNKCYEGSPTLKLHSSFLIIRLLPHLLISVFSIFFPALCLHTVPCMCSAAVHEEMDVRTISNKGTCTCKSTICSWTYCVRNWEHEKINAQSVEQHQAYNTSYTEKTIFWAYFKLYIFCGNHLRFVLYKEGNKVLWPIIYYKDL